MDKHQVKAVKASWGRVDEHAGDVIDQFYANLFAAHPEMRSAFPQDLTKQRDEAVRVVDMVISSLSFLHFLVPVIRPLVGALYDKYPAEYITNVGDAVIATMSKADAGHWSSELRDAWHAAFEEVSKALK